MRASKQELPVDMDEMGVNIREAEWGDMNIALESFKAGVDSAPIFVGLPDDRCQCHHWGYVLKGRFRARYRDREEVLGAGDIYYLSPGHTTVFDEDTEVVEFTPKAEHQATLEVVARNIEAAKSAA